MAQPLTSTDIIRERMGFGVSPMASEDTRRAYAAAGLSPLGTQERQRFEAGGGLSPMASKQEQEAWKQAEFMAGKREQAPVGYGGLGDRPTVTAPARFDEKGQPTGSFRRQLRMQEAWDTRQSQLFEQQRVAQQLDLQQREENRLLNEQRARENADIVKAKIEEKNAAILNNAFGVLADVELDDPFAYTKAVDRLSDIAGALESEDVRSTLGIIQKASEASQGSIMRSQQKKIQEDTQKAINEYISTGGGPEGIVTATKIDPVTGNQFIDPIELQKQTALIKGAGVKAEKEKEAKQPKIKAEEAAASSTRSLINTFEQESVKSAADIARLTKLVEAGDKKSQGLLDAKLAEKSVYDSKIEELRSSMGGGVTPTVPSQPQTTGQKTTARDIFGD